MHAIESYVLIDTEGEQMEVMTYIGENHYFNFFFGRSWLE